MAAGDSLVLGWRPATKAQGYEVHFYRMDLSDLAALPTGAATTLVLHHGAPIALGTPGEVVREPAVISSYLGAEAV